MPFDRFLHWNRWGLLYWNAPLYHAGMGLLRSIGERRQMLEFVAKEAGTGVVLDLCCGPADLSLWFDHHCYRGIDKNSVFAQSSARRGLLTRVGDILTTEWPSAETLVMVDSLYHFIDKLDVLMPKVESFPCKRVIFSEPVENLINNLRFPLNAVGNWLTRVDGEPYPNRFTERRLTEFFRSHGFQKSFRIGHNIVGVWNRDR